jgi:hypothetical protein
MTHSLRTRLRGPATVPGHVRGHIPAAIAMIVMLLAGCQAARMPVPDALAAAERLSVSGRQGLKPSQRLRFGPYEAHPVRRSWTRGGDRGGTLTARQRERSQTYQFTLNEGDAAVWFVACRASVESVRIDLGVVDVHPSDESALYCNLQSSTDRLTAWELDLRERHGRPLAGTLTREDASIGVVGTDRLQGALPLSGTTGYELRHGGAAIGAVEVVNNGAVWLGPDLDTERRGLLAATAAALLLLEDLYETFRE